MIKQFVILVLIGIASIAHADDRQLTCKTPNGGLTVALNYHPEHFTIKNAGIRVGFASADLLCTGNKLSEITCVGFWFGLGANIVEVKTQTEGGRVTASYQNLTDSPVAPGSGIPCELQLIN